MLRGDITVAIRNAVMQELADVGYGRLSIEAVARRAGRGEAIAHRPTHIGDAGSLVQRKHLDRGVGVLLQRAKDHHAAAGVADDVRRRLGDDERQPSHRLGAEAVGMGDLDGRATRATDLRLLIDDDQRRRARRGSCTRR